MYMAFSSSSSSSSFQQGTRLSDQNQWVKSFSESTGTSSVMWVIQRFLNQKIIVPQNRTGPGQSPQFIPLLVPGDLTVTDTVYANDFVQLLGHNKTESVIPSSTLDKLLQLSPIENENNQYVFNVDEIDQLFPELSGMNGTTGTQSMNMSSMVPLLLSLVKRQQTQIDEMNAKIANLTITL